MSRAVFFVPIGKKILNLSTQHYNNSKKTKTKVNNNTYQYIFANPPKYIYPNISHNYYNFYNMNNYSIKSKSLSYNKINNTKIHNDFYKFLFY